MEEGASAAAAAAAAAPEPEEVTSDDREVEVATLRTVDTHRHPGQPTKSRKRQSTTMAENIKVGYTLIQGGPAKNGLGPPYAYFTLQSGPPPKKKVIKPLPNSQNLISY